MKKIAVIMVALMVGMVFTMPETTHAMSIKKPTKVQAVKVVTKSTSMTVKYKHTPKIKVGKKRYKIKYRITLSRTGARNTVKTSKKAVTLTKLKSNTKYTIFVRAYYKKGKKTVYSKSVIKTAYTKKATKKKPSTTVTPNNPTVTPNNPDGIEPVRIEGNKAYYQDGYYIYKGSYYAPNGKEISGDDWIEQAFTTAQKKEFNEQRNMPSSTYDCACASHLKNMRAKNLLPNVPEVRWEDLNDTEIYDNTSRDNWSQKRYQDLSDAYGTAWNNQDFFASFINQTTTTWNLPRKTGKEYLNSSLQQCSAKSNPSMLFHGIRRAVIEQEYAPNWGAKMGDMPAYIRDANGNLVENPNFSILGAYTGHSWTADIWQCTKCKQMYTSSTLMQQYYGGANVYKKVAKTDYQIPYIEYPEGNPAFEKLVNSGKMKHSDLWMKQTKAQRVSAGCNH